MYAWLFWNRSANEKLHDDIEFTKKKKKLSFRMKLIFILVGTLIAELLYFGLRTPTIFLTEVNAPLTNYLVRLVERRYHWPIFLWKWRQLSHHNKRFFLSVLHGTMFAFNRMIQLAKHTLPQSIYCFKGLMAV